MKISRAIAVVLCAPPLLSGASESVSPATEVKSFVRKIYAARPGSFELGTFNGKFNPKTQCELIKSFFDETLLATNKYPGGCDFKYDNSSVRYPGLQAHELSEGGNLYPAYPVPLMREEPKIEKDFSSIALTFARSDNKGVEVDTFGRVVLFLRKTDSSWKVFNALLYREHWGDMKPVSCSDVSYSFLVPPESKKLLEDLPRACRDLEIKSMPTSR
jgi:hypothetical protein